MLANFTPTRKHCPHRRTWAALYQSPTWRRIAYYWHVEGSSLHHNRSRVLRFWIELGYERVLLWDNAWSSWLHAQHGHWQIVYWHLAWCCKVWICHSRHHLMPKGWNWKHLVFDNHCYSWPMCQVGWRWHEIQLDDHGVDILHTGQSWNDKSKACDCAWITLYCNFIRIHSFNSCF